MIGVDAKMKTGRTTAFVPISILLVALFPLLLMPLAAIYFFAASSGIEGFIDTLRQPDVLFALRFSLLIAFATALINGVLGTYTAYVLAKYRFRGSKALNILVNLPVAIPTVVVGTSLLLLVVHS